MRIAIIHGHGSTAAYDALEVLAPDHACALVPVVDRVATLRTIRAFAPDLVHNLCDGREINLVLALELLGIPCCGCDAVSITLTRDKPLLHDVLRRIDACDGPVDGPAYDLALFHGRSGLVILPPGPIVFASSLQAEVTAACRHVASTLGLTGYARVLLREGADGRLHVRDVDAHPDLGADGSFRQALAAAGLGFDEFLGELVAARLPAMSGAWRRAA
jgi:hypothetical protein